VITNKFNFFQLKINKKIIQFNYYKKKKNYLGLYSNSFLVNQKKPYILKYNFEDLTKKPLNFSIKINYFDTKRIKNHISDSFEYFEKNNKTIVIQDLYIERKKVTQIFFAYIVLKKNYIFYKLIFLVKEELLLMYKKFNDINLTLQNWKNLIPKEESIKDFDYFIPLNSSKKKYILCNELLDNDNDIVITSNKNICNIKIGIFPSYNKAPYLHDGFLFLDHQIIKFKPSYLAWDYEMYQTQWKHALEYLIKNKQSCIITDIQKNIDEDTIFGVSILCFYKNNNKIIVKYHRIYQENLYSNRNTNNTKYLDKILGKFSEIKFDDFYKLIPPLKLTKKSEYLVIDDLIET
jgi:hypothetical protein